jgi:arylsulfatase A-like enzyme
MGFSDPGCFGGEIKTPNLDYLAENGIRFTQMYNCARCCPTRASLMTGKYQQRVGMATNGRKDSRVGDWKMAALPGGDWELFDLSTDRTEINDLSDEYPEKTRKMDQLWEEWAREMNLTD